MKIKVAGINIEAEHIQKEVFAEKYKEYISDFDNSDLKITFCMKDSNVLPMGTVLFESETYSVKKNDNGDCVTLISEGVPYISIYNNTDYSEFKIVMSDRIKPERIKDGSLEYFHTGFCVAKRLAVLGGMTLHSSCIDYNGNGICFSAPSGTGKSTHAKLWKKRFGEQVSFINDDKPVVVFRDDVPYVCGTPWSGKTNDNHNIASPLKAIVFLTRADTNEICEMPRDEAVIRLIEETINITTEKPIADSLLECINKVVLSVPVYELKCNTDIESVDACYNKIREDFDENKK